jgi:hypothetical protein
MNRIHSNIQGAIDCERDGHHLFSDVDIWRSSKPFINSLNKATLTILSSNKMLQYDSVKKLPLSTGKNGGHPFIL